MNRRNLIKSALAVATCAVVPFKVKSEPVIYVYKGSSVGPTTLIDKDLYLKLMKEQIEETFNSPQWQGFVIKPD